MMSGIKLNKFISGRLVIYSLLGIIVIGLDRVTKYLMMQHESIITFNGNIQLFLSYNRGISWSLLSTNNPFFFTIITLVITFFIIFFGHYALQRAKRGLWIIGEVLVIAGAISNVLDRFLYQGVADFIIISWGEWSWPSFNIADVAIVCGCLIMLLSFKNE